jgi:hypothetical protein
MFVVCLYRIVSPSQQSACMGVEVKVTWKWWLYRMVISSLTTQTIGLEE